MSTIIQKIASLPLEPFEEKAFQSYFKEVGNYDYVIKDIQENGLYNYKKRFKVINFLCATAVSHVQASLIRDIKPSEIMIDIDFLIKTATLSKDKIALNAYKNIKAEFQKVLTAKNGPRELDSNTQLSIIQKYNRSLQDAILQFSQAHRDDLVSEYTSELGVVKKLLPEPVNALQIHFELRRWCVGNKYGNWIELPKYDEMSNPPELVAHIDWYQGEKVIPKKEMGTVIKYLKSKFPTADGKMISEIVKKYIV